MTKKSIVATALLAVILLVGGVVWYGTRENNAPVPENTPKPVSEDKKAAEDKILKEEPAQPEYDFSQDLDVSKWATYESEKVGVRIRYPKNWEVLDFEDQKSDVVLRSPSTDARVYSISIGLIPNRKNLSIQDLFDTFDDTSRLWFVQNPYEDVVIRAGSGLHFPEVSEGYYRNESYFISGRGVVHSFQYDYNEGQENPAISEILRKIVENFEPLK